MSLKKSSPIVVEVDDLNVSFGKKRVVKNVSLTVNSGEIIGVFGISGAGKTTMIRVITCQLKKKYWTGTVKVTNLSAARNKNQSKILGNIGYVPQLEELNLYYDFKPYANIDTFASTYGMDVKKAKDIAENLFTILDIPKDTWSKKLKKMSGGEKKRVSMALGLIHQPAILFLDEPTTGVDAYKRYSILTYLKKLNVQLGTTMFIISHDMECSLVCDKAAIMREGKLLEFGKPADLIASLPSNGVIASFTIEDLNKKKIEEIKDFSPVRNIIRAGNDVIEVLMDNYDENISDLVQHIMNAGIKITSMTKDIATFRRYFQIRIQDEEEKERRNIDHLSESNDMNN
ncbi:MAG: ABC transporter ATP-binding protein [Candidatus Lokiarchaeota archaeon]|nr:ABC transporter ATP-binding protein [Candidatus Lokiarchaeota archaeon]